MGEETTLSKIKKNTKVTKRKSQRKSSQKRRKR